MLLNDHCVIEEIREEILESLKLNENKSITYQNLCDLDKTVRRGSLQIRVPKLKNQYWQSGSCGKTPT
jgi:hypothetical protein